MMEWHLEEEGGGASDEVRFKFGEALAVDDTALGSGLQPPIMLRQPVSCDDLCPPRATCNHPPKVPRPGTGSVTTT
jgi:hypothetical protein